jgi:hypothetical protein
MKGYTAEMAAQPVRPAAAVAAGAAAAAAAAAQCVDQEQAMVFQSIVDNQEMSSNIQRAE